jgi:hypothetical protein
MNEMQATTMSVATSTTTFKKLCKCIAGSMDVEGAVEKFLAPQKGRPLSAEKVIQELDLLIKTCGSLPNWKAVVDTAKKINEKLVSQISQVPQFGQQKADEISCRKNGDTFVVTMNGREMSFSSKQISFFNKIVKVCNEQ